MNVHKEVLALIRSLSPSGGSHPLARPVLRACFLFLSALVHRHSDNQSELWKHRAVIEACFGEEVGAETTIAEVCAQFIWHVK